MRRFLVLGLVLVGAIALSGCTLVPTASSPQRIARHQIPFGLMNRTIPGTNHGRVRFITQPVYIVDATGHLAPSSRIVPSPPVLATVLRQLIVGPTQIESFAGYSSALPPTLILLSASIKSGVGYIDLASPLSHLSRADQILAVGQLVLTAHDAGAASGIVITVAGERQRSLLPNGTRASTVTSGAFRGLLNP